VASSNIFQQDGSALMRENTFPGAAHKDVPCDVPRNFVRPQLSVRFVHRVQIPCMVERSAPSIRQRHPF
jgi:hypothetical protein